jgi:hypothetical protein
MSSNRIDELFLDLYEFQPQAALCGRGGMHILPISLVRESAALQTGRRLFSLLMTIARQFQEE